MSARRILLCASRLAAKLILVDDVIAVRVTLADGGERYFLTWGRIQDVVDSAPVSALVFRHASQFSLGGRPVEARVCATLREAAGAPYFYECLLSFARHPEPANYDRWRMHIAEQMELGRQISYCGRPTEPAARSTD